MSSHLQRPAARKALSLNPLHHGANATLGAIAAHRGDWLDAEIAFRRSFELDDGTGRIHARHAEAVLISTGREREALQDLPGRTAAHGPPLGHAAPCRWLRRSACSWGMTARRSATWTLPLAKDGRAHPGMSQEVNALVAQRAGRHAEAAEQQALTLPPAAREAGGV